MDQKKFILNWSLTCSNINALEIFMARKVFPFRNVNVNNYDSSFDKKFIANSRTSFYRGKIPNTTFEKGNKQPPKLPHKVLIMHWKNKTKMKKIVLCFVSCFPSNFPLSLRQHNIIPIPCFFGKGIKYFFLYYPVFAQP